MKTNNNKTVTITNKSNGQKSRPVTIGEARVQLAKMLKWWRVDNATAQFPYWIEAVAA